MSELTLPVKLILVEEVFELPHGLVVFEPWITYALADHVHLRAKDHLELRRPIGTVLGHPAFALWCAWLTRLFESGEGSFTSPEKRLRLIA
jgi:hypothetical protein